MFELDRYVSARMAELWSLEAKLGRWLQSEFAILRAMADLGQISRGDCDFIVTTAKVNVVRMKQFEARHHHDMIGFVKDVRLSLVEGGAGHLAGLFHRDATSYDIEDPAFILALRQAVAWIIEAIEDLDEAVNDLSWDNKHTLMMGVTHGQDGQPVTFGHLLSVYSAELDRRASRLRNIQPRTTSRSARCPALWATGQKWTRK